MTMLGSALSVAVAAGSIKISRSACPLCNAAARAAVSVIPLSSTQGAWVARSPVVRLRFATRNSARNELVDHIRACANRLFLHHLS